MTQLTNDVIAQDMEQLYALYSLQNILQQIYLNLSLIEEGAAGTQITVNNTTLFYLAASYYGDATSWNVIAEANGLTDPMITNVITLTIPSSAVNTGGILSF
jgi:hypothetical protein